MPGPHSVIVAAPLTALRFPPVCARCSAAPAGQLPVVKTFRRTYSDSPTVHTTDRMPVPFCRDCMAAHERERRPVDPAVLRSLRNRWILESLPYAIPIGVEFFFIAEFGRRAAGRLARGDVVDALAFGAVAAFFALLLWWCVGQIRQAGRALIGGHQTDPNDSYAEVVRGPLGVPCVVAGPPTPTLAAVDYGDEVFEVFEANRRSFHFESADVASRFAALNADLVWDPASPAARRASRKRTVLYVALGIVALALVVRDLLVGP